MKYYAAVFTTGKTKIYTSWNQAKKEILGTKGVKHKSFKTKPEAEAFIAANKKKKKQRPSPLKTITIKKTKVCTDEKVSAVFSEEDGLTIKLPTGIIAYVDGSYNDKTGVYGYGGVILTNPPVICSGTGTTYNTMKNIAGELIGTLAIVQKAISLNLKKIKLYYDYEGIAAWANGGFKRNTSLTKYYYKTMQEYQKVIEINFVHVKSHSGNKFNNFVDRIAKKSVGIIQKDGEKIVEELKNLLS